MYGGAGGVLQLIAFFFGLSIPGYITQVLFVLFAVSGAVSSYALTRPMILRFEEKLRAVEWRWQNLIKKDMKVKLVAIMAFCTACSSAIFAVYNTPILAMIPKGYHFVWLTWLVKVPTFAVVIISSFALYYVSASEKVDALVNMWPKLCRFCRERQILLSVGMLFMSMLIYLDHSLFPAFLHGLVEFVVMLIAAWKIEQSMLLFCIAVITGIVYATCAYHQFYILFQPPLVCQYLFCIESLFQSATYTLTFYYGMSSSFLSHKNDVIETDEGYSTPPGSSSDLKKKETPRSILHVNQALNDSTYKWCADSEDGFFIGELPHE